LKAETMGVPEILSDVAKLSASDRRWLMTALLSMPWPGSGGGGGGGGGGPRPPPGGPGPNDPSNSGKDKKGKEKPPQEVSQHATNPLWQALKRAEKAMTAAVAAVPVADGERVLSFAELLLIIISVIPGNSLLMGTDGKMSPSDRLENATLALNAMKPMTPQDEVLIQGRSGFSGSTFLRALREALVALRTLERARDAWIFRQGGPNDRSAAPAPSAEAPSVAGPSSDNAPAPAPPPAAQPPKKSKGCGRGQGY
jgi:hypothetical protein